MASALADLSLHLRAAKWVEDLMSDHSNHGSSGAFRAGSLNLVGAEDDRENDRSLERPRDGYLSGVAILFGIEVNSILDNAST
jgi:hypothetical protein